MEDCYLLELIREMSANERAEGDGRGQLCPPPRPAPGRPSAPGLQGLETESCGNPDPGWECEAERPRIPLLFLSLAFPSYPNWNYFPSRFLNPWLMSQNYSASLALVCLLPGLGWRPQRGGKLPSF